MTSYRRLSTIPFPTSASSSTFQRPTRPTLTVSSPCSTSTISPTEFGSKLVHIHFHLKDGEVFAARDIQVPRHGVINIMQPLIASEHPSLYGYHYFVDDDGNLSPYEYMEAPGPDLSGHHAFIKEICQLIQERGLQRKLGLSLRHTDDTASTHELEYAAKRTCIDVPFEIPLPYSEDSFNTMTEFIRDWPVNSDGLEIVGDPGVIRQRQTKSHLHHVHHRHTDRHVDSLDYNDGLSDGATISDGEFWDDEGMAGLCVNDGLTREVSLAGTKLDQSSELYDVVSYISDNIQ
ncbi:hypothetical protein B0T17DRAFT_517077 [Bombardia bombarda]|uniref:Uncharacterized protein n=1 Tax=Bombardia bombarda TaxID=252184 RepID=A0AA39XKL6_9PEZI|nr:hypothetical protein B0T17DRAFT_517077 [Bombardia bombarda]